MVATVVRIGKRWGVGRLQRLASNPVPSTLDVLRGRARKRAARNVFVKCGWRRRCCHHIDHLAVAIRGHVVAVLEEARVANHRKARACATSSLLELPGRLFEPSGCRSHPRCGDAVHIAGDLLVHRRWMAQIGYVATVVAHACVVRANGDASKSPRRVAVRAVIFARLEVVTLERGVLVVRTGCAFLRGQRTAQTVSQWRREAPRPSGRFVVGLAPRMCGCIVRARVLISLLGVPPTRVEDALKRAGGVSRRHGLHTEALAGARQRRLHCRERQALPPVQGYAPRIVARASAKHLVVRREGRAVQQPRSMGRAVPKVGAEVRAVLAVLVHSRVGHRVSVEHGRLRRCGWRWRRGGLHLRARGAAAVNGAVVCFRHDEACERHRSAKRQVVKAVAVECGKAVVRARCWRRRGRARWRWRHWRQRRGW